MFNPTILGRDEASQTVPTATWATGVQATPFGAGKYNLQIPTVTQVFDSDSFEFSVDDSGEPQYRLKDTGRGAYMRTYTKTDEPASLWQVGRFKIKESGNGNLVLEELSYSTKDEVVENTYVLTFPSSNKFILKSSDKDGVIDESEYGEEIQFVRTGTNLHESQKSFVRGAKENKEMCEALLQGGTIDSSVLLPFSCVLSMGKAEPPVTFSFLDNGNLEVSNSSGGKLTLVDEAELNGISITNLYGNGPFLLVDAVELLDINYDGYLDMKVRTSSGAYNFYYDYYVYNPKTYMFDATPLLSSIVNPSEDLSKKTITSDNLGRGIGDLFYDETYQFRNGKYVLIREESQNMPQDGDCSVDANCSYVHIIKELVNGTMVVTKRETLSPEQFSGKQSRE
jgi:hypothetical protein